MASSRFAFSALSAPCAELRTSLSANCHRIVVEFASLLPKPRRNLDPPRIRRHSATTSSVLVALLNVAIKKWYESQCHKPLISSLAYATSRGYIFLAVDELEQHRRSAASVNIVFSFDNFLLYYTFWSALYVIYLLPTDRRAVKR